MTASVVKRFMGVPPRVPCGALVGVELKAGADRTPSTAANAA
jgi:hypothetical protein